MLKYTYNLCICNNTDKSSTAYEKKKTFAHTVNDVYML